MGLTRRGVVGLGALLATGAARADALRSELSRLEAASGGRLGVAVLDLEQERSLGHRADERFPMCSTFKILACGAVLARVDAGQETLDRHVAFGPADLVTYSPVTKEHAGQGMALGELCAAAMTQSDNTAANLILSSLGGPAAVTAFARALGDGATRLDRSETSLNEAVPGDARDTTTPAAMANDLRRLVLEDRLSFASRAQLLAWMETNRTGDARLRAGTPKNWRIGDKTGSGDFGTANDVAVIQPPGRKPLIVAVYLTQTQASMDDRNAIIAGVGRAVAGAV